MEEKVEYWMEKYDKDVEAKTHELEVLKASKANDLSRLQELTKLVRMHAVDFTPFDFHCSPIVLQRAIQEL